MARHDDMKRGPIGALFISLAALPAQVVVISPVSGSTISSVAWFCSALAAVRRRPADSCTSVAAL